MNYIYEPRELDNHETYLFNVLRVVEMNMGDTINENNAMLYKVKRETIEQLLELGFTQEFIDREVGK